MPSCCAPFESTADRQFDPKKVESELDLYRRKGPRPTTRMLLDGIAESGASSGTVLDVGAGIGVLALGLLERGASSAVAVDASTAYLDAAREHAARQGRADAIRFVHADFVSAAPELAPAAIVTLDRVVCCYPSWPALVAAAASHAERCLALSYPRDLWYMRATIQLDNGRRRLTGNAFRTFVHPAAAIASAIEKAGFRRSSRKQTLTWAADVYVRL